MVACELLSCTGIHRVNILDESGSRVCGILSQTDIINFFINHTEEMNEIAALTVAETDAFSEEILSVAADSLVIDALKVMSDKAVSCVAVVDAGGFIIGNISMTDIKYILNSFQLSNLWTTCAHLVTVVLASISLENDGRDRIPVFFVRPSSSLLIVMQKIIIGKIHRIWVEDDLGKPIGVVALCDILRVVLEKLK